MDTVTLLNPADCYSCYARRNGDKKEAEGAGNWKKEQKKI
jgi:hypothetical protein